MPHPRKRFGQHFLIDEAIIQQIILAISANKDQHLVEIGPGRGAITAHLVKACKQLDVIEIDRDLVKQLQKQFKNADNLVIHEADALRFDFSTLGKAIRIVGNLPYNISTPLIFHLIKYAPTIEDMVFMLQKEVVQRLSAAPGNKDYGRLSIMVQYDCQVHPLLDVPPEAFYPPPAVNSAVVQLIPYRERPHTANDYDLFADLVKTAFSQRRKTIRNSLKSMVKGIDLEALGINPISRPENLSLADYVNMSNSVI